MALAPADKGKGRAIAVEKLASPLRLSSKASDISLSDDPSSSDTDSDSPTSSISSSSSTSISDDEELTDPEKYLELARQNVRRRQAEKANEGILALVDGDEEGEMIALEDPMDKLQKLPLLDPGQLPPPYFEAGSSRQASSAMRDIDSEQTSASASKLAAPAPPVPPPELTKSGKPLTKKEKKALKEKTAGPSWFDLPAPPQSELPRLYREVEAMRLRNQLDPKRFYRKDEGEGKGIKGLPKHFAIGTILPTDKPFGGASSENLPRSERKRTIVDELVDDAEARRYAKRKFLDLQSVRGAKGRGTLKAKQAKRKPKW
ncbi:Fcf2 pre-rRNA processing-domain-containing protein [Vararia minispora EC-137]|uniref:Fcf2 pre-rRNA processing-domain-containing protein n=1 Tax=Vararia minispora EC-137 TaxID=1314806 RepID=A0ACB8QXQ5_9AGAM|nr:Fcf2 pre-rRNA processing-domain-containing protein [Vararia minispora EC-137]